MHRFEIEQLAIDLYREHGFDPALPPGIYYVCLRLWGGAVLRYEVRRDEHAKLYPDGGWELSIPPSTTHPGVNRRMAIAVALWYLERQSIVFSREDLEQLASSLIIPLPALTQDVLEKGMGANDIARVYAVDAELAQVRVRQLLEHGSGERPSIDEARAAELLADDDTLLRGLL